MASARRKCYQADKYGENVEVDDNVKTVLPPGSQILSVEPSGASLWVQTVRIDVQEPDGNIQAYFKKTAADDHGRAMMAGAFEAETALHAIVPNHVPKPTAWGTYKTQPDIHFYLCEFVEMSDRLPSSRQWAEATSQLHVRSAGKCPQGRSKFGFHVTTHLANIPIDNSWHDSWESFWAWQMKSLLKHEERIRGPNHEFSRLKQSFFDKVIPRLLRPLEARGRRINACLIHSDLWPGNVMHKAEVRDLVMFDSCPYWGHNEADLAVCRNPRYRLGKAYVEAYRRCMPEFPSHPTEDFEDRNALYAMKFHILLSILYPSDSRYRRM
ncbi:hypothetical protein D8B26_002540 [Coccidioides posadasii str. Silveira]|uniref:uncharacterized protein n=1 Tax=Coccidioides posadasii (strain RMSCC 757 / Silveira) TaxID=443226 RepID=UPI001BEE56FD|nr:hypothetical protein D8B26_002540 [Coccidioides posadasii str. Silveira]